MAPNSDPAAAAAGFKRQTQTRRAVPIIPAIPLKLSRPQRSARPITPDENPSEGVAHPGADAGADATRPLTHAAPEQQPIPDPLTPDTQASGAKHASIDHSGSSNSTDTPSTGVQTEVSGHRDPNADTVAGAEEGSQHDRTPHQPVMNGGPALPTTQTQLPPPFYPAEQRLAQPNGHNASQHGPETVAPTHRSQASVDGIVFGGLKDIPVAPSVPQEREPEARAQFQTSTTRQPPGLMRPEYASPFYPGHAHHISQSQAAWAPPAITAAPADPPYANGRGLHPHFPSHGPFDGAFSGQFSPGLTPVTLNGTGTSRSQSPLKHQYPVTQPSSEHEDDRGHGPYQNGNGVQPFAAPPNFDMPFELLAYLNAQLGNPKYADALLRVSSPSSTILEIPVHRIIVARSPAIAFAIERSHANSTRSDHSLMPIDLFTQDMSITPEAANEAIKVLYGGPFFTVEAFCYGLAPFYHGDEQGPITRDARKRMDGAISYAAAGKLFGLASMHKRGVELIRALLRWDTVEQALEYGLGESIYARSREEFAQRPRSPIEYDATTLLERDIMDFLAFNLPPTFGFYSVAPELQRSPRLPQPVAQPSHNPRLSGIRFGDVPPGEGNPDLITRTMSSILLSLPIGLLDGLLKRLNQFGRQEGDNLMREVVSEREGRRKKALSTSSRQTPDTNDPQSQRVFDNLFYEEQLKGQMLIERRQGHHANRN